ncbi:hypothetical protein QTP86_009835 [Hemibagrus guttatus]|nr:hypothetical protein QTP86_009835 [Hemibagrus guttatus]
MAPRFIRVLKPLHHNKKIEGIIRCSQCGESFTDQSTHRLHRCTPDVEKLHNCSDCGKSFGKQSHLQQHQCIHMGEKPYRCSQCGKTFIGKNTLTAHQCTHTGWMSSSVGLINPVDQQKHVKKEEPEGKGIDFDHKRKDRVGMSQNGGHSELQLFKGFLIIGCPILWAYPSVELIGDQALMLDEKAWLAVSTLIHPKGVLSGGVFNSHLRESFNQIPREVGDIKSEWTMFSSSIVDAAIRSCGRKGTPEAAEAYRQAKRTAALVVSEAKTRVWEEFGEAMEKDYRTASGKFWQTIWHLRREESEVENSEVDSFITQAEVTQVVQQLLGGKAPGVDEIRPEYLKSLDVVGMSWLTRLCNIVWQSGTVPLDWATGVVIPLFKKGDRRVCSNYRGITLLSLPGKVYSKILERRVRPVLEGSWEFAQPVHMCFVDLEKAFDRVPRGILWEVLWEYGVCGPLLRAVWSLYNRSRSLVCIASYDVALLAPSSLDLQHALGRFAAECEAAGMRVSTSKSEAMVLDRKKVACTLQVGGEVLPQVEEFKYLGVLFTSEGRMDREIDRWIGAVAAVMRSMYRSVVVKKELSRKATLSIYQSIYVPILTHGHELWVMTERKFGVEPLLLHIERGQLRWLGHLFRMPPGHLPGEVFRSWEEAPGKTQDTLERLCQKSWRKCLGRGRRNTKMRTGKVTKTDGHGAAPDAPTPPPSPENPSVQGNPERSEEHGEATRGGSEEQGEASGGSEEQGEAGGGNEEHGEVSGRSEEQGEANGGSDGHDGKAGGSRTTSTAEQKHRVTSTAEQGGRATSPPSSRTERRPPPSSSTERRPLTRSRDER